ncbi:MAG: VWA domain-containing protein [Bacteroidetes bacterium]|nr:VWA domain-containing protein [Bacteroidota bacterium]
MKNLQSFFSITAIIVLLLFANIFAASAVTTDDKTLSPYFFIKSDNPAVDQLPLKSTDVKVNIAGVIAEVTVTQVYENKGKNPIEAIYVFPASTRAAIFGLQMVIGSRTITAEIREKEKARQEYQLAVAAGKRATLLEQHRPNVFQMNVANIQPGDVIKVVLRYTELLVPDDGKYEFVYPTVVGPRYTGQPAVVASTDDQFVGSPSPTGEIPYTKEGVLPTYLFDLNVFIDAGMPIKSLNCGTHKVDVNFEDITSAVIKLGESESFGGNRDYILDYRLAGDEIESGLLLYEHGDENFFLLMVQPPKTVELSNIPAREYVFIVDISGSMSGFPLDVSKKLMRDLIVNLRPKDKFNVLLFAGSSSVMAPKSVDATKANLKMALNFIGSHYGGGGTELLSAMNRALALPHADGMSRSFVIVTDGYVTVEKRTFETIRNNLNEANMFAFGIGSSVNRYLIEGIAKFGHTLPMIVKDKYTAPAFADKFRKYISSPVLTDIEVDFGSFQAYDMEPISIPDVLAARPIIIFGKWKGDPSGTITIKGVSGEGDFVSKFDVAENKPKLRNAALRYLWAREKISMMDDFNHLGKTDELIAGITKLGLDYNLMTAYTSFIAIDDEVIANDSVPGIKVDQPLPLPQGVSNSAVGFGVAVTGSRSISSGARMYKKTLYSKDMTIKLSNFSTDELEVLPKTGGKTLPDSISVYTPELPKYSSTVLVTKGEISADCSAELSGKLDKAIELKLADLESYLRSKMRIISDSVEIQLVIVLDASGKVLSVNILGDKLLKKNRELIIDRVSEWEFSGLGFTKPTVVRLPLIISP